MLLNGVCLASALIASNLWISLLLAFFINLQFGFAYTGANSLLLDQVPSFRGTVMSFFTAANGLGKTLGASIGGVILLFSTYGMLGLVLGTLGFTAAIIVYHWAK